MKKKKQKSQMDAVQHRHNLYPYLSSLTHNGHADGHSLE